MERKPERKKASDFPQELLNLLDGYVHGGVSRRQFLDRAQKFAVGGITAMALFEMLRPNYAWAIQIQPDDKRIKTSTETLQSPEGYGTVKGYLSRGLDRLRPISVPFHFVGPLRADRQGGSGHRHHRGEWFSRRQRRSRKERDHTEERRNRDHTCTLTPNVCLRCSVSLCNTVVSVTSDTSML